MLPVVDLRAGGHAPRAPRAVDPSVREEVRAIIERVRAGGDGALLELTRELDGAELASVRVPAGAIAGAAERVPEPLRQAIAPGRGSRAGAGCGAAPPGMADRGGGGAFRRGGEAAPPGGLLRPGRPRVVPLHGAHDGPPRASGRRARGRGLPAPAPSGELAPAVLYACLVAEVSEVHAVGGAQAVAALAFGTASIAPVDRIVGPGNAWVTGAKAEVAGLVGFDGLAGPTELAVVADGTADPRMLAVDVVAQAEHDPLAEAWLVTWEEPLAGEVRAALEEQAAAVCEELAPEHLQVVTAEPDRFLPTVRAYCAAFVGPATPVALGDYGVGSNHVLPTMGTARFASGLRSADFVTVSPVVEASTEGLARVAPEVVALARAEGLPGHARAVEARLP